MESRRHRPHRPGATSWHGVPHEWFGSSAGRGPGPLAPEASAHRGGFWSVTRYDDCVTVNRDYEHFSSYGRGPLPDMDEEVAGPAAHDDAEHGPAHAHPVPPPGQQGLHPADDPGPGGSRSSRYADAIIDAVCEQGTADFVEQISAELPLLVIADLMGVPQEDRHKVFDWSNRMIGSEDPEYQIEGADSGRRRPWSCSPTPTSCAAEAARTPRRTCSRPHPGRDRRREAGPARARPVLHAAHRGRQRDHPEPHLGRHGGLLRPSRPVGEAAGQTARLLPAAVEEMLRFVTPGHALPPARWPPTP